jgi:peptidoglycan/LPS O-acetylase OafA/YrhL
MEENILKRVNLDALGIGASLACAVHCALLPLLLTILPLLGSHMLENKKLEYGLLFFSFLAGSVALGRGYFRYHRRSMPLLVFTAGFILLLAGHLLPEGSYWVPAAIFPGAAGITGAHILNMRRTRQCTTHKHHT